jgi:hypothetical protein
MYIHSRHTDFKIFKHETKTIWFRCTRDTCVKSEGYIILTNRGETISNTHYTATACPLSDSLLSQASDSQVFQWNLNAIFLLHFHHLHRVQSWKKNPLADHIIYMYRHEACIIFTHSRDTAYNPHYKAPPSQTSLLLCLPIMVILNIYTDLFGPRYHPHSHNLHSHTWNKKLYALEIKETHVKNGRVKKKLTHRGKKNSN